MKNYFKIVGKDPKKAEYVFFNDAKVRETEVAFETAVMILNRREEESAISIFEPALHPGPWDQVPIIGHRRRGAILLDIEYEKDPEELERLGFELRQLDREYINAGRDFVPLQEVA